MYDHFSFNNFLFITSPPNCDAMDDGSNPTPVECWGALPCKRPFPSSISTISFEFAPQVSWLKTKGFHLHVPLEK